MMPIGVHLENFAFPNEYCTILHHSGPIIVHHYKYLGQSSSTIVTAQPPSAPLRGLWKFHVLLYISTWGTPFPFSKAFLTPWFTLLHISESSLPITRPMTVRLIVGNILWVSSNLWSGRL